MKTIVLTAAVFALLSVQGQTALSPSTPAISPAPVTTPPAPALSPGDSALSLDQTNLNSGAGLAPTNGTTPGGPTNVVSTNLTLAGLSQLLTNLQTAAAQALPAVAAFNDEFTFFVLDTASATNFLTDLGATNLTTNPGSLQLGSFIGVMGTTTNVTGGATNRFGLPVGTVAVPITRDTLRALLVIQNDLERLLPLLQTLNTGTNTTPFALNPGFVPGSFTNIFGGAATSGTGP